MLISSNDFTHILNSVADTWLANTDQLGKIDSLFGDGDHGVTIGKIAVLVKSTSDQWRRQPSSIKALLESLSAGIMGINGGSAGPLYGTVFEGMADALGEDCSAIDANTLKRMLDKSRKGMYEITKARQGAKTMMDALIPAVDAALDTAKDDPLAVLAAASKAAAAGAEATRTMISKYGRARSYGEQTIGTPDAGAVSTALLFEGLHTGAVKLSHSRKMS